MSSLRNTSSRSGGGGGSGIVNDEKTTYDLPKIETGESSTGYVDDIESQNSIDLADELHQGLKARHIQLIALGGCIGTGLFVGSGSALATCGPAGLLTAYLIMSTVIFFIMNELGEMVFTNKRWCYF